jgi:hypothetical protein
LNALLDSFKPDTHRVLKSVLSFDHFLTRKLGATV